MPIALKDCRNTGLYVDEHTIEHLRSRIESLSNEMMSILIHEEFFDMMLNVHLGINFFKLISNSRAILEFIMLKAASFMFVLIIRTVDKVSAAQAILEYQNQSSVS